MEELTRGAAPHHDPQYQRPINSRYVDPIDVVWLSTATRLRLTLRRHPDIFSMTDGAGLLCLGTRDYLDEDDNLAQMFFHEVCHWITNGEDSYHQRDWGFPLWGPHDHREHACLRLQAWWSGRHGLRELFGPTGEYRQYYDRIPDDPLQPLDQQEWEATVVALTAVAIQRAQGEPWWGPVEAAMTATRTIRDTIAPFVPDYQSELPDDPLPLFWGKRHHTDG